MSINFYENLKSFDMLLNSVCVHWISLPKDRSKDDDV
jgi:hypothetical protein